MSQIWAIACFLLIVSSDSSIYENYRNEPDFWKRVIIIQELDDPNKTDREVVRTLIAALSDKQSAIRAASASALRQKGLSAAAAIPELILRLADASPYVRSDAAAALLAMQPDSIDPLIQAASAHENFAIQLYATRILGHTSSQKSVVYTLMKLIRSNHKALKEEAIDSLGRLGKSAEPAIDELLELLSDDNASIRLRVIEALTAIGCRSPQIVDAALELIHKTSPVSRVRAVAVLGRMGPAARNGTARLLHLLRTDEPNLRCESARALRNISSDAHQSVLHEISEGLRGRNDEVGELDAAKMVGCIGDSAWSITLAIDTALHSPNSDLRAELTKSILQLGRSERVFSRVLMLLDDPESNVRREALYGLLNFEDQSMVFLPRVRKFLSDQDPVVRGLAINVISRFDSNPGSAKP